MAEAKETKDAQDPSEAEFEQEALKESKEDEIRQSIIEKYGLDEGEQSDLIDRLTQDSLEGQKRLSKAIQQKIDWRNKAQDSGDSGEEQKQENTSQTQSKEDVDDTSGDLEDKINEAFRSRDLASLDVSDDLKKEVDDYSKLHKISILEAVNSEYIKFRKEQEEKQAMEEQASASSSKGKGAIPAGTDFSQMSPKDFDTSTEEGQKAWEEYKKWLKSQ